jgi:hypothetical protein
MFAVQNLIYFTFISPANCVQLKAKDNNGRIEWIAQCLAIQALRLGKTEKY